MIIYLVLFYINDYYTSNKYYGVTSQNKGWVKVQTLEDISDDKSNIYNINPMETFLGKSQLCDMTGFSGARDKEVFNGNKFCSRELKKIIKTGTCESEEIWSVVF